MPHSIPDVTGFQIIFAKNPPVFYPGESIQGTIELNLTAAIAVQSIQAHLFSRSFSKIIETNRVNLGDENQGSATYIGDKVTVWGNGIDIYHNYVLCICCSLIIIPLYVHSFSQYFILQTILHILLLNHKLE